MRDVGCVRRWTGWVIVRIRTESDRSGLLVVSQDTLRAGISTYPTGMDERPGGALKSDSLKSWLKYLFARRADFTFSNGSEITAGASVAFCRWSGADLFRTRA